MEREQQIQYEILNKVEELYRLREGKREFIPGKTKIHYAGRVYDEKEMQAVVRSALDFHLTLGKEGQAFAAAFQEYMGVRHALVTNSGSSANLLAVSALCSRNIPAPLAPGDEVITTALAFPTTLNPILQNELIPVFVDVEEGTYNIDAKLLETALSGKTRAIMFAHTVGNPAEVDAIMAFAKEHELYVVEDVCDALDSRYDGRLCGTFGDFSTYSFYAAHHMTMGEGGAVLTNNPLLYHQALSLRDWGRACYCPAGETNPDGACGRRFSHKYENLPDGYDHKYVFSNIGYNLKPLDPQCAMGLEQLKKLPLFSAKRKEHFHKLHEVLKEYERYLILPKTLPRADPSWFCFPLTVRVDAPFTRNDIVMYLESCQIETRMLFSGNILRHPGYKDIKYRIAGDLKQAENVLQHSFFIGVYPGLTEEMMDYMAETIRAFFADV
ncbi:MAG TPA: lipopolysaccharide biosynthesis protein RfbH [Clostridia bacterium]|nr:lipopolysaccharide biosynthesis protein RfbH [Clostridia bacterium]